MNQANVPPEAVARLVLQARWQLLRASDAARWRLLSHEEMCRLRAWAWRRARDRAREEGGH